MRLLKSAMEYRNPLSPTYNKIPPIIKSKKLTSRIAFLLELNYAKIGAELT